MDEGKLRGNHKTNGCSKRMQHLQNLIANLKKYDVNEVVRINSIGRLIPSCFLLDFNFNVDDTRNNFAKNASSLNLNHAQP